MKKKRMDFFERYLSLWVVLCIVVGVALGALFEKELAPIANWEIAHVNVPVAILIWMMIFPMMVQVDFSSLFRIKGHTKGIGLTVLVNWLVKPFTMAFFAWVFFDKLYGAWLTPEEADQYIAGAILLGAAPCTAMVFVWSYLSDGDPNYTLLQVSINDLILLIAFVPIVQLLLGITDFQIPWNVLAASTVAFVVIPLMAGLIAHYWVKKKKGVQFLTDQFLPRLKPVSIIALMTTLILLFAFQGSAILQKPIHIVLIAIPLIIQTYFVFGLTWFTGKKLGLPFSTCAPGAMIGASNFFELAVAVAIALFGLNSGAALATVVGVLIEVPIMLSLVNFARRNKY